MTVYLYLNLVDLQSINMLLKWPKYRVSQKNYTKILIPYKSGSLDRTRISLVSKFAEFIFTYADKISAYYNETFLRYCFQTEGTHFSNCTDIGLSAICHD